MKKKQLPGGVRVLLGFISFLLCIVLFVCSLLTILVADLGLLTSKGGLQKLVQDIILSTSAPATPGFMPAGVLYGRNPVYLDDVTALPDGALDSISDEAIPGLSSDIMADIAAGVMDGNLQDALADAVIGILGSQSGEADVPISKEEVVEFIEQSSIPEFISDKVSGVVVDVINGEATTTITKDEVIELIQENKELIEDTLKTEIPDEVIESVGALVEESNISQTIQQEVAEIVGIEPPAASDSSASDSGSDSDDSDSSSAANKPIFRPSDVSVLENVVSGNVSVSDMRISDILALVRIITAPTVLIGFIAVCLLLSALLFLTNWGRPNAALRCSGISYLLAGLLFLLPSAVAQFAPSLFGTLGIAGTAIRQVLLLAGSVSLGVTVFGLVLIIGGAVWGSALKKKRVAAAACVPCEAEISEVLLAAEEAPAAEAVCADDPSDANEALPAADKEEAEV